MTAAGSGGGGDGATAESSKGGEHREHQRTTAAPGTHSVQCKILLLLLSAPLALML